MNGPELHALTGAYAADALTGDELREFERHVEACPACAQEVTELRATAARLGGAVAAPAPPGLRARVLAEVDQVRQVSPLRPLARVPARTVARWMPVAVAAAAAGVIAVGAGFVAWNEHRQADRMDRMVAILTDPERRTVEAAATSGGSGTVVVADDAAVVVTRGLRNLPDDRTYQLWVIAGPRPRSAGLLGPDGEAERVVDGVPAGAAVAVTVEPSGGSRRPTSDPVFVADLQG